MWLQQSDKSQGGIVQGKLPGTYFHELKISAGQHVFLSNKSDLFRELSFFKAENGPGKMAVFSAGAPVLQAFFHVVQVFLADVFFAQVVLHSVSYTHLTLPTIYSV